MLLKWHTTWDKHRFERQTTNDYIFYQFVCLALAHSFSLSLRAYSHFSKRIIKFEMMSGCLRFVSAALWQHAIMPQRHTNGRQSVCGDSESNKKAGCRSLTTYAIPLQSSSIAHWTDRHTHSTQNTHTRAHRVHTHFINKLQVPGKTLSMHWGSKRTITILQNNLMIIYYYYHWIISLPSWLLVDDNDDDNDNRAEPMQINNIRVCYVCYALRPSAAVRLYVCVCARCAFEFKMANCLSAFCVPLQLWPRWGSLRSYIFVQYISVSFFFLFCSFWVCESYTARWLTCLPFATSAFGENLWKLPSVSFFFLL